MSFGELEEVFPNQPFRPLVETFDGGVSPSPSKPESATSGACGFIFQHVAGCSHCQARWSSLKSPDEDFSALVALLTQWRPYLPWLQTLVLVFVAILGVLLLLLASRSGIRSPF